MNHKYARRSTGQFIYFSEIGKKFFDKSKEAENFKYIGEISAEDQEKEESAGLKGEVSQQDDATDKENYKKQLVESNKVKAVELTAEELEARLSDKKIVIDETTTNEKSKEVIKTSKPLPKKK